MNDQLITQIDSQLPQTQCTLCGYPDCKSYATALATQQETNPGLCVPGQHQALNNISKILNKPANKWQEQVNAQSEKPSVAHILLDQCIGCTKCINACPVDAIIGSNKKLHAIITSECTGCKLCIDPCPVDCIQLMPSNQNITSNLYKLANKRRLRYQFKQNRLNKLKQKIKVPSIKNRQQLIQEALARSNGNKSNSD